MPYVNYTPALLSARRPQYDSSQGTLKVKVENFGLSTSQPAEVEVRLNDKTIAQGTVESLEPYGVSELILPPSFHPDGDNLPYEVIIRSGGVEMERHTFLQ